MLRGALSLCVAMAAFFSVGAAHAQTLDLNDPNDAIKATQKFNCSLEEGETIVYWWQGSAYSRVPGEKDTKLFNVEGHNMRACKNFQDDERGYGFRSVSREILLYKDPVTNEILETWENPWTGEEVDVIHVANDPVNMRGPIYAYNEDGSPHQFRGFFIGDRVWTQGEAPLFYDNPLAGDFQDYVGNKYQAMEGLNQYAYADDLLDASKNKLESYTLSWMRTSEWLPWMKMRGRSGFMVFTTVGGRVDSFEDLPDSIRNWIEDNYPKYAQAPELLDDRPNVTSWKYFKEQLASEVSAGGED